MKRVVRSVLSMILMVPFCQVSWAGKVFDKDLSRTKMVQIKVNADETFTFESCIRSSAESLEPSSCRRIGNQEKYTISDLNKKRAAAGWKGVGVFALDIALVAGAVLVGAHTGLVVGATLTKGAEAAMTVNMLAGSVVGAAAGGGGAYAATKWIKKLNPFRQFKKADLLKQAIAGKSGNIAVDDIEVFTELLESALQ